MFRRRTGPTTAAGPAFRPAMEALELRDVPATLIQVLAIGQPTPVRVELVGSELTITGTQLNDSVSINKLAGGTIQVSARADTGRINTYTFQAAAITHITFHGGDGNDQFMNMAPIACTAYGEDGNDILIGGSSNDVLVGGVGADALYGGAGSDLIIADANDFIAPDPNDIVVGGPQLSPQSKIR
jgi:hypothetical protein